MVKQVVQRTKEKWFNRLQGKDNSITVSELLDMWVEEELKPGSLSNGTVAAYVNAIKRIKKHRIGSCKVRNVTPEQLQEFLDFVSLGGVYEDGTISRPLSMGYQLQFSAILRGAFRFAVFPKKLINENPMLCTKVRKNTENVNIFAGQEEDVAVDKIICHEQYLRLTDCLRDEAAPALLAVQIAYYTGLRIGEICGLTWQDINLEEQFLTVRRSVGYNSARHTYEIDAPKRKKIRTIYFGDTLRDILRDAARRQEVQKAEGGSNYFLNYYREYRENERCYYELCSLPQNKTPQPGYTPISFVCVRVNGCYESSGILRQSMQRAKRIEGLEDFHFHMLRHTYSSNLLAKGALPVNVQEMLGHTDIKTTMSIYAHATREEKKSSAKLLDEVG